MQGVPGDREREELLIDHLREKDRREKETRKAEEKKRRAAFRLLLESSPFIKARSVLPAANVATRVAHCSAHSRLHGV